MRVLVINSGSSSLKYRLIDMKTETVLAKGLVECIAEAQGGRHVYEAGSQKWTEDAAVPNHEAALHDMVAKLTDVKHGVIASVDEIDAVGHRVVHGGEAFVDSAVIDEDVVKAVDAQVPLAPLHNPANLMGIRVAREILTRVPHVAVFDTAFHETMPNYAYLYGLPYEFYEKYHVRRYGFHGTSHRFVARRAAEMIGKTLSEFTGITCHLGNGCSIAAVRKGQSVDTSMGLTPLEGLLMGTRSGDIDPAIPFFLVREAGLTLEQVDSLLNKKSGMLGVSGVSNDARSLWEAAEKGHKRAILSLDMFAYRAKKYLGAYMAVLNGCEAIVFTGGIGERDTILREKICSDMNVFGVKFDKALNEKTFGREGIISAPDSKVVVMVVPTNEELEIARDTVRVSNARI